LKGGEKKKRNFGYSGHIPGNEVADLSEKGQKGTSKVHLQVDQEAGKKSLQTRDVEMTGIGAESILEKPTPGEQDVPYYYP